jgi:hypothetical protein
MLWWLVDHSNGVIIVLGLVLLGLGAWWWNTRYRAVGAAALVTLALLLTVVVLSLVIVTDRKQLTADVKDMTEAINADRIEAATKHFADTVDIDFMSQKYAKVPRDLLATMARQKLESAGFKRFIVWGIDVEKLERPNATVQFYIRPEDEGQFATCTAEFILVGERDWRVKKLTVVMGTGGMPTK